MPNKVFILDEITVVPGKVREYYDAYMSDYAPGARDRGMTLESVRLTPPFEWLEGSNTIHFQWSVADTAAWWTMRIGGLGADFDPSGQNQGDFWKRASELTVNRRRNIFIDFNEAGKDA